MLKRLMLIAILVGAPRPFWGESPTTATSPRSQAARPSQGVKGQSTADQRGTQDAPFIVEIKDRPKGEEQAAKEREAQDKNERAQTWNIRLTAAIVVVAFLQFVGILIQACLIRRQASYMVSTERPWMVALMEAPPKEYVVGGVLRLACHIKNSGKTPAFLLAKGDDSSILQKGAALPETPPIYAKRAGWGGSGVMLPQGSEIAVWHDLSISDTREIYEGTKIAWFYGSIEYRDAFEKLHETRYCFRFTPPKEAGNLYGFEPDGPDAYNRVT
jgi:hypothetical protein